MHSCVLWIVLVLTLGFILTLTNCQSHGPPRDKNGNRICSPSDVLCGKFKSVARGSQHFLVKRELFGLTNKKHPKPAVLKCNNKINRWKCELRGKVCYTNGKCGDLLEEGAGTTG